MIEEKLEIELREIRAQLDMINRELNAQVRIFNRLVTLLERERLERRFGRAGRPATTAVNLLIQGPKPPPARNAASGRRDVGPHLGPGPFEYGLSKL